MGKKFDFSRLDYQVDRLLKDGCDINEVCYHICGKYNVPTKRVEKKLSKYLYNKGRHPGQHDYGKDKRHPGQHDYGKDK